MNDYKYLLRGGIILVLFGFIFALSFYYYPYDPSKFVTSTKSSESQPLDNNVDQATTDGQAETLDVKNEKTIELNGFASVEDWLKAFYGTYNGSNADALGKFLASDLIQYGSLKNVSREEIVKQTNSFFDGKWNFSYDPSIDSYEFEAGPTVKRLEFGLHSSWVQWGQTEEVNGITYSTESGNDQYSVVTILFDQAGMVTSYQELFLRPVYENLLDQDAYLVTGEEFMDAAEETNPIQQGELVIGDFAWRFYVPSNLQYGAETYVLRRVIKGEQKLWVKEYKMVANFEGTEWNIVEEDLITPKKADVEVSDLAKKYFKKTYSISNFGYNELGPESLERLGYFDPNYVSFIPKQQIRAYGEVTDITPINDYILTLEISGGEGFVWSGFAIYDIVGNKLHYQTVEGILAEPKYRIILDDLTGDGYDDLLAFENLLPHGYMYNVYVFDPKKGFTKTDLSLMGGDYWKKDNGTIEFLARGCFGRCNTLYIYKWNGETFDLISTEDASVVIDDSK